MRRIGPSWHRLGSRSGTSPPPHRSPHDEPGFMFEELERFVAAHRMERLQGRPLKQLRSHFSRSPRRGQPCQASVATFRAMPWTDLDQRTALLVVVALTPAVWTRMAPFSAYRPRRQVKFTGKRGRRRLAEAIMPLSDRSDERPARFHTLRIITSPR
jgi:hypothetical protein